jgi:hypothetical protein
MNCQRGRVSRQELDSYDDAGKEFSSAFPRQNPVLTSANISILFCNLVSNCFALAWVANPCAVKEHHCRLKARHVASRRYPSLIGQIPGVVP